MRETSAAPLVFACGLCVVVPRSPEKFWEKGADVTIEIIVIIATIAAVFFFPASFDFKRRLISSATTPFLDTW